jgi:hypothetical protein
MAIIDVVKTASGEAVYATDSENKSRRKLLGYISPGGFFHSARPESESVHRQKWGPNLRATLETMWQGKPVP